MQSKKGLTSLNFVVISNPSDGEVALGMLAYLAGRPPAIGEVVFGSAMLRGEGDLSCMSASCICGSGEEQVLLLHGLVCPDDSGNRWSKGSLPDRRIVPRKSMISTTSYSYKEECKALYITKQCATIAVDKSLQGTSMRAHTVCKYKHQHRCSATDKLTLFALLFVFELADMESREPPSAPPLGVTSDRQLASSNASGEVRAPSEKMELILPLGWHDACFSSLLPRSCSWGYG